MKKIKRRGKKKKINAVQSVKRALFIDGSLDEHHKKTKELLKSEMKQIQEEQTRKYNFDFQNERPLKGIYEWTKIGKTI